MDLEQTRGHGGPCPYNQRRATSYRQFPTHTNGLAARDLNPISRMETQISLDESAIAPDSDSDESNGHEVAPDIAYLRCAIVNVAFIGLPHQNGWVLVDAGVPKMAGRIGRAAQERLARIPNLRRLC